MRIAASSTVSELATRFSRFLVLSLHELIARFSLPAPLSVGSFHQRRTNVNYQEMMIEKMPQQTGLNLTMWSNNRTRQTFLSLCK
jgi:hypothetical protein